MTLPDIQGLFNQMEEFPPIALLAIGFAEANKPKPIAESIRGLGVPIKKGKVKRGHISG